MRARTRELLRDDAGFSLMELLVALAIGTIVLSAVMMVFVNGMQGEARVTDRADSTARARTTTDIISSLLQAATCNFNTAPITSATATSVTFTGALGGPEDDAVQYRVRWDSATKTVYQDTFLKTGTVAANDSTLVYPSTPTTTKVIGTNMAPADGATLFKYYAFNATSGTIAGTDTPSPILDANTRRSIVAIQTSLLALPEHTTGSSDPAQTAVEAQSVVGQVDPSNPGQGTQC
jgi:prepilin-type N-terminal cleavage/methylation domain-containing protein